MHLRLQAPQKVDDVAVALVFSPAAELRTKFLFFDLRARFDGRMWPLRLQSALFCAKFDTKIQPVYL